MNNNETVTLLMRLLLASLLATLLASVPELEAAEVKGNVEMDVKVGVVLQKNTGIANKNSANIGAVTGKSTRVGGQVKSHVRVGAVIQTNKGIANKNAVNIGSISD